jgi:hypothetical protein
MHVLQFVFGALVTFFASTLAAASVGLYGSTFDPPTQSEVRIIRCALGDTTLSRACQEIAQEISRVVVLVNEDGGRDTLASTRERLLMVKKALKDYGDRVEIMASTPEQTAKRARALLAAGSAPARNGIRDCHGRGRPGETAARGAGGRPRRRRRRRWCGDPRCSGEQRPGRCRVSRHSQARYEATGRPSYRSSQL